MGRPPLRKKGAFTAAERQARRRKRLRAARSAETQRKERLRHRAKMAEQYIPVPPGVTVWVKVAIPAGKAAVILQPQTRPLASFSAGDLEDEDVLSLIAQLNRIAHERGLIRDV
jgi:hypothetical protein